MSHRNPQNPAVVPLPPRLKVYHRNVQYVCVYAIGPKAGRPIKVGYATDIFERLANINCGHWEPVGVHYLVWTPGREVASRVEREAHRLLDLAGLRVRGEWFDVSADLARDTIHVAANNLKLRVFSHRTMLKRLTYLDAKEEAALRTSLFITGKIPGGA